MVQGCSADCDGFGNHKLAYLAAASYCYEHKEENSDYSNVLHWVPVSSPYIPYSFVRYVGGLRN